MSAARRRRVAAVRLLTLMLTGLVALAGCGTFTDRGAAPPPSATPAPTTAPAVRPTPTATTGPDAFERSGRGTNLRITLPPAGAAEPYPLVVALHSLYHDGTEPQREWGLDELARSAGFAVVYPDGLTQSWNGGTCCGPAVTTGSDDVGWLRALISHLRSTYPIDSRRVSIIGLSNGGMLAYRYACEHGDELAGVAVVAASLQTFGCVPPAPLTTISIHGGADGHVPYAGAAWSEVLQTAITSVDGSLAPFRSVDRCAPPTAPGDSVLAGPDGQPWVARPETSAASTGPPSGLSDPAHLAAGMAPPPPMPPPSTEPVAVRYEAACQTPSRVIQYVLPALAHGWPPLVGDGAFATSQVIWNLLSPQRSAQSGPRL